MTEVDRDTYVDLSMVVAIERSGKKTILHLGGTTVTWNVPIETALQFIEINRRQGSFATP